MAAYSVDRTLPQGGDIITAVKILRDAQNRLEDLSNTLAQMDDAQIATFTGFSGGTPTQMRTVFANAAAALDDPALVAIMAQIVW